MSTPEETLTYVYAAVPLTEHLRDSLAGLRGIYGSPVLFVTAAPRIGPVGPTASSLAFATSRVPLSDFGETALKNHFEDMEWLESVARAHHDVVQALSAHTTVLPLRMATVYQDDDRARQALAEQHRTFAETLTRLTAHTEFGVKLYLAPAADPPEDAPATDTGSGAPRPPATPGKAYLQRRRAQHHALEAVYDQAQEAAATVEAIAFRYASQRVRHQTQRGALTGPAENVVNDAYLVPDEHSQQFKAAIEEAAGTFGGVRVEVTGPWAPYSFAMPPEPPDESRPPTPAEEPGP
ncbi:GvpL/GvpF family gas vesicle protein [Streptomyces sp. SP18CS02]|uniref:GvpL/GvpF family gas vesicle protein n=1 Tax=Streptomyces sp. SP18CS02 TaxID=3002531 RepID=UPI002E789954|nr:GvpL/GvpF family gas vesicle protein [Streptomyces sp. SP18CS02]MEE1752903.1 GvpL/GvpF family gas vesicle protein [Streptomyces sp. SP18CS02]